MEKLCPRCGDVKPVGDFYKNPARRDGLSSWCAPCFLEASRESRDKLRREALDHLGARCAKCGYDEDSRALQIDHVDGNGSAERRGGVNNNKLLRAVLADVDGRYQLLCANCNVIKRFEGNEHKGARTYRRDVPTERVVRPNRRWTPDARAKQSEDFRKLWEDPEHRASMSSMRSDLMKKRWASGEVPNRPGIQTVTM